GDVACRAWRGLVSGPVSNASDLRCRTPYDPPQRSARSSCEPLRAALVEVLALTDTCRPQHFTRVDITELELELDAADPVSWSPIELLERDHTPRQKHGRIRLRIA